MQTLKPLILGAALLAAPMAMAQSDMQSGSQTSTQSGPQTPDGARPGNVIGTRSSLPLSTKASNITAADTNSPIAPTPPEPAVGPGAGVSTLLAAANQSIASGQTGTADEALEQAETHILQNAGPQYQAQASGDPVVAQIEQARQALGNNDTQGATQTINQILASGAPELND